MLKRHTIKKAILTKLNLLLQMNEKENNKIEIEMYLQRYDVSDHGY